MEREKDSEIGILEFILKILYEHDCDGLASRLLESFGSFQGIMEASSEELLSIKGMTLRAASFFGVASASYCQALFREACKSPINSEAALIRLALALLFNNSAQVNYIVYFDKKGMPMGGEKLDRDDKIKQATIGICRSRCAKAAIFFNRPKAVRLSVGMTRLDAIVKAVSPIEALGVEFLDYIEYCPYKFYSLRRLLCGSEPVFDANAASEAAFDGKITFTRSLTEYISAELKRMKSKYFDLYSTAKTIA